MSNGKFPDIKVPGSVLDSEANVINNSGQIVGMYTDGGRWHGYLFDSVTQAFQTIDVCYRDASPIDPRQTRSEFRSI